MPKEQAYYFQRPVTAAEGNQTYLVLASSEAEAFEKLEAGKGEMVASDVEVMDQGKAELLEVADVPHPPEDWRAGVQADEAVAQVTAEMTAMREQLETMSRLLAISQSATELAITQLTMEFPAQALQTLQGAAAAAVALLNPSAPALGAAADVPPEYRQLNESLSGYFDAEDEAERQHADGLTAKNLSRRR